MCIKLVNLQKNSLTQICLWILLILSLPLYAQAKERVAVLEFQNHAGITEEERSWVAEVVRGAVRDQLPVKQYMFMNKENMITLLEEHDIKLDEVCEGS